MSTEDIVSYCEIKDCAVSYGNPEYGFVSADGSGLQSKFNNYRRFLALNELSALPNPEVVLKEATTFRIKSSRGERELTREEFQGELERFQEAVGL